MTTLDRDAVIGVLEEMGKFMTRADSYDRGHDDALREAIRRINSLPPAPDVAEEIRSAAIERAMVCRDNGDLARERDDIMAASALYRTADALSAFAAYIYQHFTDGAAATSRGSGAVEATAGLRPVNPAPDDPGEEPGPSTPAACCKRCETFKQEAQIHAQEARTQRATVHEIYRLLRDGKGEPGDWNGAEPVRQYVERCKAIEDACRALVEATHRAPGAPNVMAWATLASALDGREVEPLDLDECERVRYRHAIEAGYHLCQQMDRNMAQACRELREAREELRIDRGYMLTCPWCAKSIQGQPISIQMSHIVQCGDRRIGEERTQLAAALDRKEP